MESTLWEGIWDDKSGCPLIRLEFDSRNSVIRWTLQGKVTDEVFSEYIRLSAASVPKFPAKALILDLTHAESFDVQSRTLRDLASKAPTLPSEFPRVIVAQSNVTYGLSRMFTILSEEQRPNSYVVRTMDEAYQLLKIRAPEFEPGALPSER